jgi:hypothetical protein
VIAMAVTLSISSDELSDDRIQKLTSDLCRTISKETDIEAELPENISQKGARGGPIILGLIFLTILKSGSAVAFLNVLKSFLDRVPSIKVTIKQDGVSEVTIDAKNMHPDQIKAILEIIEASK